MDMSPVATPPNKGDAISADWARSVTDAANAVPHTPQEPGALASPFGTVPPAPQNQMLGTRDVVMPFDTRLVYDPAQQVHDVYCALPSVDGATPYIVYAYGIGLERASGGMGHVRTNPWVKIGSVSGQTFLVLALTQPTRTDGDPSVQIYNWQLALQVYASHPSWAWDQSPTIPIAYIRPGEPPGGVLQYTRGVIHIGSPAFAPFTTGQNLRINGVGNVAGETVIHWEDNAPKRTFVRNIDLYGANYASVPVEPRTIIDYHGNSHSVLELISP